MTRLIRFRFSLATLLIATAWSAVMVWMNVTPRVTFVKLMYATHSDVGYYDARWGWPCDYAAYRAFERFLLPRLPSRGEFYRHAMLLDAVFGVLLVVGLTWASESDSAAILCRASPKTKPDQSSRRRQHRSSKTTPCRDDRDVNRQTRLFREAGLMHRPFQRINDSQDGVKPRAVACPTRLECGQKTPPTKHAIAVVKNTARVPV